MGIVNNRTIRLTDYRFLNDPVELIYGLDKVDSELAKYDVQTAKLYRNQVVNIRNGIGERLIFSKKTEGDEYIIKKQRDDILRYYVFSMTHQADNLQMWHAYGSTGCRLKLNSQALLGFFANLEIKIYLMAY